jgi:hypothetical protein
MGIDLTYDLVNFELGELLLKEHSDNGVEGLDLQGVDLLYMYMQTKVNFISILIRKHREIIILALDNIVLLFIDIRGTLMNVTDRSPYLKNTTTSINCREHILRNVFKQDIIGFNKRSNPCITRLITFIGHLQTFGLHRLEVSLHTGFLIGVIRPIEYRSIPYPI